MFIHGGGRRLNFALRNPSRSSSTKSVQVVNREAYFYSSDLRHFALVVDVTNDHVTFYVDGEVAGMFSLIGDNLAEGWLREIDCQSVTSDSYVGLLGRAPGVFGAGGRFHHHIDVL
jgi:hypothetical protein